MALSFATCERTRAFQFLEEFYPKRDISSEAPEVIAVLDWVEKDVIRIPDPAFHPGGGIVTGKNYQNEQRDEVMKALEAFHVYATALPKKEAQEA